jgi:coatomer subunit beta
VRRNAVLAISALCKLPKGDLLVPDADELIERFLGQEQDVSAKRNALMLLTQHSQVRLCGGSECGAVAAAVKVYVAAHV